MKESQSIEHWKVGDKMGYTEATCFIIGEIQLHQVGEYRYEVRMYDEGGVYQGCVSYLKLMKRELC